jgi:TonB family protein
MFLQPQSASASSSSERLRGAFGASLLSHAVLALLLYVLMTLPGPASRLVDEPRKALEGLVFLDRPGPGGGGGGGGNQSTTPPRRLETRGPESLAVPLQKTPPLTPPRQIPQDEQTPPPMALVMPVKAMDAGQIPAAGVLDNANLAPTTSQGSGRDGGAGTGGPGGSGPGSGPGAGDGRDGGCCSDVYQLGSGIVSPVLVREVKPAYTPDAMRARIQGNVWISAIVLADGTVTRLRVVRSLDRSFGLDEEALKAVQQWRFKPGTRLGRPVAVQIDVSVGFGMR